MISEMAGETEGRGEVAAVDNNTRCSVLNDYSTQDIVVQQFCTNYANLRDILFL